MKRKNQSGIVHLFLIIVFVLLLIIGLLVFFRKETANLIKEGLRNLTNKSDDIQMTTEYKNPFDEKAQYSNPFEENKNPFDYLNE